jgi:tartrate dehydratase alpha subunit/fumarate hydratase class I-like protein
MRADDIGEKVSSFLHEFCYQLSPEVLLKKIAQSHSDNDVSDLQMEILAQVNNLGIGTPGWGAIVRQRKRHSSLT